MSFLLLAPAFMVGGMAITVPIILHFLRHQPTEVVTFATLKFLQKSLRKTVRLNKIRRWLVLLARCAIFLLLALAFARPFFSYPFSSAATATMIVLDTSYSMGADGAFDEARLKALHFVQTQVGSGDFVGLIFANSHPKLVVPMGHDLESLTRKLLDGKVSSEANSYDAALRMADSELAATQCGTKKILWFGDDQFLAWQGVDFQRPLSPGVTLESSELEPRVITDVGIDEVKIPAPFTSENQKLTAQIKVHNWSSQEQKRVLHVELGGKEVARTPVDVAAGETVLESVDFTSGPLLPKEGDVRLDVDEFPANDVRYFALNPQVPIHAGIWPPGPKDEPDLLAVALAPSLNIASIQPVPLASLDDVGKCDVFVLRPGSNGDSKITGAIVAAIGAGKSALVFADDDRSGQTYLKDWGIVRESRPDSREPLHLGAIDFTRPEVALFAKPGSGDLFQVRFTNPPLLQLPKNEEVIASFEDGTPAIIKLKAGNATVVVVGSGLDRSSTIWPLQSTFLPFVQETLKHLISHEDQVSEVLVGDPLPGEHPGVNTDVPGVVGTRLGDKLRLIAVNVDPAESDLTPWTNRTLMDQLKAKDDAGVAKAASASVVHQEEVEQHQLLWWYAVLVALSLLFLEILVANRTPI